MLDEGAGYVRVSDPRKQRDNHSPDVQRAAIEEAARREGYLITVWDSDQEKGRHTVKRPGYQRLLEACRDGRVKAIFVFSTSRWGRQAVETTQRAHELDKLDIPMYSVTQNGWLKPGLLRHILFGLDEEYCRTLAANVRPARRRGAEEGTHQGPTPYGYQRIYPPWNGKGKRPPGDLVVDESAAWVVRELFARYAAGDVSCRALAQWLNTDPRVPRRRDGKPWADDGVRALLINITYTGQVAYDQRPQGYYERAKKGDAFIAAGRHEALVDIDLWHRVQDQLHRRKAQGVRARAAVQLGAGLLVCSGCGSPMRPHMAPTVKGHHGSYLCTGNRRGNADCTTVGYRMDVAHAALLAELRRLRGHPWTAQAERHLQGATDTRRQAATLRRKLDTAKAELTQAATNLARVKNPDATDYAIFDEVRAEIRARINALEAQLADIDQAPDRLLELRTLHAELHKTDIARELDDADLHDPIDRALVRTLLLKTVASASAIDRQPQCRSTWLRLEIAWSENVQVLLDAGLLRLDEPAPAPIAPDPRGLRRQAQQRYRNRRRVTPSG